VFPSWTVVLGFVIGATIGSFLNMAIYRLPRGLSFINPSRSFCPKCEHSLDGKDLWPLLSWLSTRGRCRYCKEPVSSRYFWVELLTGLLFSGIWWTTLVAADRPIQFAFYALMAACLVMVIFIDAELYIIPDELNAAIFVVAIAYHALNESLSTALWGALLGWGLLWGIAFLGRVGFGKDAMGDGDIKMMRGVGALLGPGLLVANLAIAVVLGIIGGVVGIALSKRQADAPAAAQHDQAHTVVVAQGAEADAAVTAEEAPLPPPTPIPIVLLSGAWYLFCLDIVALFVKPLERWVVSKLPQEVVEDEENWEPSLTTIPFGPYLAAGALVCMLFARPIEAGLRSYMEGVTGGSGASASVPVRLESSLGSRPSGDAS